MQLVRPIHTDCLNGSIGMSESKEGWAERRSASLQAEFQARLELLAGWAVGRCIFSLFSVLDNDLRFCHSRDFIAPDRFRHDFGLCGSMPTGGAEKRFFIN
jgi:hypothetical protein